MIKREEAKRRAVEKTVEAFNGNWDADANMKFIIDEIYDSIGSCGECEYYDTKVCPYDIECNPPEDFYCKNFKRKY